MRYRRHHRKKNPLNQDGLQQSTQTAKNGITVAPPDYGIPFIDNSPVGVGYALGRSNSNGGRASIQRETTEEEDKIQAKPDLNNVSSSGGAVDPGLTRSINRARSSGQPLDQKVRRQMSSQFGYDFESVRIHNDVEADTLSRKIGARAFTTGSDIFFSRDSYDPTSSDGRELIVHELSHVVQQRSGRVGKGGGMSVLPAEDHFEREADVQARKIVSNGPVRSRNSHFKDLSATEGKALQRYVDKIDTDGDPWRVTESGDAALWVEQAAGGQELFAAPKLVKQANLKLAKAGKNGSFIRLKTTGNTVKSGLLKGVSSSVREVEPRLVTLGPDPGNFKLGMINMGLRADDDGSKSKEFALWADCGRSSRAVMGTDDSGSMPRAHVKMGSKEYVTGRSGDPANFTIIYRAAIPGFMKSPSNQKYLKEGVHYDLDAQNKKIIRKPAGDKAAKKMYWELGTQGRNAFDFYAGINVAADPEIGGGYTMATEYGMPGFKTEGSMTWNFHWAGVVMKDGDNNVTLENYAVSYGTSADPVENAKLQEKAYKEVNRKWVFQMYGTRKKEQTFHEQHLKSGTHGSRATSFAVKV